MNPDTYAAIFIIAASLIGGACLGLRLRAERRANHRPMLTSDYLAPWTNRAPGEMPERGRP